MPKTENRDKSFTFAVSEEERKRLRKSAERRGLSIAGYVRQKTIYGNQD